MVRRRWQDTGVWVHTDSPDGRWELFGPAELQRRSLTEAQERRRDWEDIIGIAAGMSLVLVIGIAVLAWALLYLSRHMPSAPPVAHDDLSPLQYPAGLLTVLGAGLGAVRIGMHIAGLVTKAHGRHTLPADTLCGRLSDRDLTTFPHHYRRLARRLVDALDRLYASRAASEGWIDNTTLTAAHTLVWDALQRLVATRPAREALADARRYPDLRPAARRLADQLRTLGADLTHITAAMEQAAAEAGCLDHDLTAADHDRKRADHHHRTAAALHTPVPVVDQTTRLALDDTTSALMGRLRAAAELVQADPSREPLADLDHSSA